MDRAEVRLAGMAYTRIEVSIRRRCLLQNRHGGYGRNVIRAWRHGTVVWRISHCRSLSFAVAWPIVAPPMGSLLRIPSWAELQA